MNQRYFKGYYMVTNRCNLNCSYCVLEDAPHQLRQELDLESKKALISHLYEKLNFRRLTLSGGEVLICGKRPPNDFIELLRHIRQYRSGDPVQNLEIEVYTNGTFLDDRVAEEMAGVVDLVAVTIDSYQEDFLVQIGRTNKRFNRYFEQIVAVCRRLAERNIELKLHSVIGQKNHHFLADEVGNILDAVEAEGGKIACWKFFQYMSYDDPACDQKHHIPPETYQRFVDTVTGKIEGRVPRLHFKSNQEMNASLFNILSYGNAQYMRDGDTWSSSKRTQDLRSYSSMEALFSRHDIDQERFCSFHQLEPCLV